MKAIKDNVSFETFMTALEHDGAVIVENAVPADLLKTLNGELDTCVDCHEAGKREDSDAWQEFHGRHTKKFSDLLNRSPASQALLEDKWLVQWADKVLQEGAGAYWLNTAEVIVIGPGAPAQLLHRDQDNWPLFSRLGPGAPEAMIGVIFALSDFHETTGATRVIPGSHKWTDFKKAARPEDSIAAEIPAGSALYYSGKTIHGGGANLSKDYWRRAIHVSFCLGWLRPVEAHPLNMPLDKICLFSEHIQQLHGYRSYDPSPNFGGQLWMLDTIKIEQKLSL